MALPEVHIVGAKARRRAGGAGAHSRKGAGAGGLGAFFGGGNVVNLPFLAVAAVLIAFGLVVCYSAVQGDSAYSFTKQLGGVAVGFIVMMIAWGFDYRRLAALPIPLLVVTCALILSPHLPVIGVTTMGATSWIKIGMQIQPGEFAKITMVLYAAALVSRYGGHLDDLKEYIKVCFLLVLPFICIMTQPDLGTGLVYMCIAAAVLFMGGARGRYIVGTLVLLVLCVCAVFAIDEQLKYVQADGTYEYKLLKQYQRNRLFVFMNQDSVDTSSDGYNLKQAMIAIGSGGFFGKGMGSSTQGTYGFLPESQTDFIFCVLAEEFGFVGVLFLLALYAVLIALALQISRTCGSLFGMLIVCGIVGMWMFQILENVGMCCGLMPITGIPLPFVSYGSSFMVVNFFMLGLICSVHSHESGVGKGV